MRRILSNIIFQHVTENPSQAHPVGRNIMTMWGDNNNGNGKAAAASNNNSQAPALLSSGQRRKNERKKRSINARMHHLRGFIRRLDNKRKPLVYIIQSDVFFSLFFVLRFPLQPPLFRSVCVFYLFGCYSPHGTKSHKLWCKRRKNTHTHTQAHTSTRAQNCVAQSILCNKSHPSFGR